MRAMGLTTLVLLAGCNSNAQPTQAEASREAEATVAPQTCPQFRKGEDEGEATRPEVPAKLAAYVSATETTVTVSRDTGKPACIDVSYGAVERWDEFAQGRLLGVGLSGHEFNSYLVVDRDGTADPVETGRAPVFSPDGRRFASVDISASGFGAFEGLGVWAIEPGKIRNIVLRRDLLELAYDWQLERWASDDCVVFSAGDTGLEGPDERKFYELDIVASAELSEVPRDSACR